MPMGWDELAIIIVLAMVIIGPSRLPEYAAKLAQGVRKLRVMAEGAKVTLKDQLGPEYQDINWRQYDPRQYDPRRIVREALAEPLDNVSQPFKELADEKDLARILKILQTEYVGFVDIGLINDKGELVNYVGPYNLKGHNYAEQTWFNQVRIKGRYISDVFMGFRKFPHVIVAVRHSLDSGESFIVRATLDTHQFDKIISSMGLEPGSDAFLLNRAGILQTDSQRFGKVLDQFSLPMPPPASEAAVLQQQDGEGNDVFFAYAYFPDSDFVLAAIKPKDAAG